MPTKPERYTERDDMEGELDDLLELAGKLAEQQIAAASCGTSLDFRRANALQDRLSDHRDHFVRRWSRAAEDAQVEEIERAARRR